MQTWQVLQELGASLAASISHLTKNLWEVRGQAPARAGQGKVGKGEVCRRERHLSYHPSTRNHW